MDNHEVMPGAAVTESVSTATINKPFAIFLGITCVLCGALIMVVEVLGSRVIGPFFGVSLFVWTSLITVTLLALAIGYAVGGYFSDRYFSPKYLYAVILIASVFVLWVPLVKGVVLKACLPLGLRWGAFASTLILFGPSLFLLGCVSPYLAKIATRQMQNLGTTVGGLYALSTIGSTAGTVLTGFVLIAYLGVSNIFTLVGVLLIVLSVSYFVLFEKRYWTVVFLLMPLINLTGAEPKEKTLADGTKVSTVFHAETYYGEIKVLDYSYEPHHIRELLIDGMIQGGMDMNNHLSIFDYSYYLQYLTYMNNPKAGSCLVFGVGMGAIVNWYNQQGINCDIVDIDPEVIKVAQQYFGLQTQGEVAADDARYFLEKNQKQYDIVVLDVFTGDITPSHLLSLEALQQVKRGLASDGVLGVNIIGSLKQQNYMTASVIHTLKQVFRQVELYPAFDVQSGDGVGNLILLAYEGEPRTLTQPRADQIQIHPRISARIRHNLGKRYDFPAGTRAMVISDEYNPIDFYDSWLRELNRSRVIRVTDWDVLLG
ncbi:MAG: fused MFS/spermidine synthase [Gammaproteobacteria bacterium]|nr:fused MFS/spermidine synthase [Gammaproteobacteria bacterium]MDH5801429.1 fused MFS/spermidine synthase [Gammaproteobacteria bacterium]